MTELYSYHYLVWMKVEWTWTLIYQFFHIIAAETRFQVYSVLTFGKEEHILKKSFVLFSFKGINREIWYLDPEYLPCTTYVRFYVFIAELSVMILPTFTYWYIYRGCQYHCCRSTQALLGKNRVVDRRICCSLHVKSFWPTFECWCCCNYVFRANIIAVATVACERSWKQSTT